MINPRLTLVIAVITLCAASLYARGGNEASAGEEHINIELSAESAAIDPNEVRFVKVTGTVRLVGTGLFNDLVISGEREWYIAAEDREKLHNLQHRRVTVEAEETAREIRFASGISAGIRYTLRSIKIILIE